jgi:hypothetical protein
MAAPRTGRSTPPLTAKAVFSELVVLEQCWGGARSAAASEQAALGGLLHTAREHDRRPGLTLAELINSALLLERNEWCEAAIVLLDVDESEKQSSMTNRHGRLAESDAYDFKSTRTLRRRAKKRGDKTVIELALQFAAEMLVRYGEGVRPTVAEVSPIDHEADFAFIESAMANVIAGLSQLNFPLELDGELRTVLRETHGNLRWIQDGRCFLAATPALELRKALHDKHDTMYILSRRDETCGIAQDPGWPRYKEWMKARVTEIRGEPPDDTLGINHKRLIVRSNPAPLDVRGDDLYDLHGFNALYTITAKDLEEYALLHELTFGFALSLQRRFLLISGPDASPFRYFRGDRLDIHELARAWCGLTPSGGPMSSLVVTDPDYVNPICNAFEKAITGPHTNPLKPGPRK